MKVGKAIYNILSQSTEVKSNFPLTDANYSTGSELVKDGNFPNGDNWIVGSGWSIGGNKAIASPATDYLYQADVYDATTVKTYRLTYTITVDSGRFSVFISGKTGSTFFGDETESGTYTHYFTTTGNSGEGRLYFSAIHAFDGSLTNVSVQEFTLNKIFPELAPPGVEVPYIVYSVVSNSPSDTKNANGDIDTANIEVYGFQDTYNKAVDLGVSIRAALDRKTGTYNTIKIQSTNYVNEQMDVNEARKLWAAIQDYSIRIKNI